MFKRGHQKQTNKKAIGNIAALLPPSWPMGYTDRAPLEKLVA